MKTYAALLLAVAAGSAWCADTRYRGRFYFGPDVQVFEPCAELKAYWVDGTDKALKPLITRSEQQNERHGKANLPLYVEVLGRVDSKTKREGPAEDYDGLLHVSRVLKAASAIPKRCRE